MKPSNTGFNDPLIKTGTGIDWAVAMRLSDADPLHSPDDAKVLSAICEAAAQIAIAEYRKELAAKVARMDADTTDPEMIPSEFLNYKYGWNDAIRTFRVLLNENDDAE